MRQSKNTIIDFYQGAYGPTIRIDVQDIGWLKLFRESLVQLSSKKTELDLLSLNNVEKDEISGFKIALGFSTKLSTVSNMQSEKYPAFLWTVSAENVKRTIGAIDWFLESNKAGHYYLYEDDVDIELAFKE